MRENGSQVSVALNDYLSRPAGPSREAWLAATREKNPELANEVESLASFIGGGDFLNRPASPLRLEVDEDSSALAGNVVDGYELLSLIGEGGFGLVFRARRQSDGSMDAVVKLLRESLLTTTARDRFNREQEVLRRLSHDGIARMRSAGVLDGGTPYFTMDFVPGESIREFAAKEKLSAGERIELMAFALDALDYAHAKNVVHRDLKPSNLLAYRDGHGKFRVVIIDFGIAKLLNDDAASQTTTGQSLGTEAYMSPEQIRHPGRLIDAKSDIYAMGVVLAELLLGKLPLGDADLPSMREAILRDLPDLRPAPGQDELSQEMKAVLDRALRKAPERRFASAGEFASELRRVLAGVPVQSKRLSRLYRARHFCSRYKGLTIATGVIAASLVAGTVVSTRYAMLAEARKRDVESQQAATALTGASQALRNNDRVAARALLESVPAERRDLRWRWLATQSSPARILARELGQVRGLAISDEGIALGTMKGSVHGVGLQGERLWTTPAHERGVGSVVAFRDSDRMHFASVGADGYVCVLDSLSGAISQRVSISDSPLSAIYVSPNPGLAFAGGVQGVFRVNLDGSKASTKLPIQLSVSAITGEDDLVVIATRQGELFAIDASDFHEVWRTKLDEKFIMSCVWLSGLSEPLVAASSAAGDLWLIDGASGDVLSKLSLEPGSAQELSWDRETSRLITGASDGSVGIVSIRPKATPPMTFVSSTRSQHIGTQVCARNGVVYSVSWSGELVAEAMPSLTPMISGTIESSEHVSMSSEGSVAAVTNRDSVIVSLPDSKEFKQLGKLDGSAINVAWLESSVEPTLAVLTDTGISFAQQSAWDHRSIPPEAKPIFLKTNEDSALAWGGTLFTIVPKKGTTSRTIDLGLVATAAAWIDGKWHLADSEGNVKRWTGNRSTEQIDKFPAAVQWFGRTKEGLVGLAASGNEVYFLRSGVATKLPLTKRQASTPCLSADGALLILGFADGSIDAISTSDSGTVELVAASPQRTWRCLRVDDESTLLALDSKGQMLRIAPYVSNDKAW